MKSTRYHAQQGFTWIETMFALAIMSLFLILSMRMYDVFRHDADLQDVKADVDQIFQAMNYYYQANCSQIKNVGGTTIKKVGTLDPSNNPPSNMPVNLTEYLLSPLRTNVLLTGKYVAQFNRQPNTTRTILKGDGTSNTYALGQVVIWTAQVAVQVTDAAKILDYKNILAADCISSYSGQYVLPCTAQSADTGDYLVWERLPSSTGNNKPSSWPSMEILKQFNQMYTTYPINVLTTNQTVTPQNYLCGG